VSANSVHRADAATGVTVLAAASSRSPVDEQYAALLEEIVTDDGMVRYELLATDPLRGDLQAVVAGYALEPLTDKAQVNERKARWCNAYNANVLHILLEERARPGFTSINVVPGVFSARSISVAGESLTLDGLKDRLRAMNDARIHAALVFGARACPPLRCEPYEADRIEEQLDDQCLRWLDDPSKHHPGRRGLLVSQIFEWHASDFDSPPYHGTLGFIRKHGRSGGSLRNAIRGMGGSPQIRYLPFAWNLNSPITFERDRPTESDEQDAETDEQ
jgi:hypothetical protein